MTQSSTNSLEGRPTPLDLQPSGRAWPALLMSMFFHIIVLTTIGLMWTTAPSGTDGELDRPVGIALAHRMPDRDRYVDPMPPSNAADSPEKTVQTLSASSSAPPAGLTPPFDLDGILKSIESAPSPNLGSGPGTGLAGEMDLGGDAFGRGRGKVPGDPSGEATTMVFGVSGSGSQFVYVFDRSDSMNGFGGKPLRAAKAELIRSLRSLTDKQRFQLVFYNEKPTPFRAVGSPMQMLAGDGPNVTAAEQYIRSINAFGGTEHEAALKMALRLAPDVIFFLTDARIPRLSELELREIQSRSESAGTTIHAIEFGPDPTPPDDSFLRDLASMNHGQYQYVNVRNLEASTP